MKFGLKRKKSCTDDASIFGSKGACSGFSIVEVLMACIVGAVIFAALFYGLTQGYNLVQKDRESLRATQILVGKIEGIRLCSWGTNQLFNTNIVPRTFSDSFYPVGLNGNTNNDGITYSGTITITTNFTFYSSSLSTNNLAVATTPPNYSNQVAQVVVNVTWSDFRNGKAVTFNRSMKTFVAQYGIQNYVVTN